MPPVRLRLVGLCVALAALPCWPRAAADLDEGAEVDLTLQANRGPAFTNGVGMKLVRAPKGRFLMGSPEGENGRKTDENRHEVQISRDFYLGAYEVTQKQYQTVMGTNPSYFSATGGGAAQVKGLDTTAFPVDNVSYHEAIEFCDKLNRRERGTLGGWRYRLPTEAEWEYCCRAGARTRFHTGDALTAKQANFGPSNLNRSCKVGSYRPNAWGIYDMHGNALEWCLDWYAADYHPKGGNRDPSGPPTGKERIYRGGAWNNPDTYCRASSRWQRAPSDRVSNIGFRVAVVPPR
jgi:formylglycine-generating enzyme required for sulfatase activity